MTLHESISSHQKEIEVSAYELSSALMQIRELGGFVWRMDVSRVKYTLLIYWNFWNRKEEPKQQELL